MKLIILLFVVFMAFASIQISKCSTLNRRHLDTEKKYELLSGELKRSNPHLKFREPFIVKPSTDQPTTTDGPTTGEPTTEGITTDEPTTEETTEPTTESDFDLGSTVTIKPWEINEE